jgi:hypothetical protein
MIDGATFPVKAKAGKPQPAAQVQALFQKKKRPPIADRAPGDPFHIAMRLRILYTRV